MLHSIRRRTPSTVLLGALLGLGLATAGQALERAQNLAQLARQADVVMIAECTEVRSYWNPSHTMILTEVTHRAADSEGLLKGALTAGRHTFVQPGGQVDNLKTVVSHQATFTPGERSVLFLEPPGHTGLYGTVDGLRGKVPIQIDDATGREFVEVWLDRQTDALYLAASVPQTERLELTVPEIRRRLAAWIAADTQEDNQP